MQNEYEMDPLDIKEVSENSEVARGKKRKVTDKQYRCNECDYSATMSSTLKKHKESIHEGIRFSCSVYDFAATTAGNLKQHKESKHEGMPYPCSKCD